MKSGLNCRNIAASLTDKFIKSETQRRWSQGSSHPALYGGYAAYAGLGLLNLIVEQLLVVLVRRLVPAIGGNSAIIRGREATRTTVERAGSVVQR